MSKSIIFGAIYKANKDIERFCPNQNNYLNDQRYRLWIPIQVIENGLEKIYMIDTYQNEIPYEYTKSFDSYIEWLIKLGLGDNLWYSRKPYDYFYTARVLITEHSIKAFDLIADLKEYESVSEREFRYYNDEDKLSNIRLRNDGKSFNIVKKESKINFDKKIISLIEDIKVYLKRPFKGYDSDYENLFETVKLANSINAEYDKKLVEKTIKIAEFLDKQDQEYKLFVEKLDKEGN